MAQHPIPTGLPLMIEVLEERVLTLLHRLITQRKAHLCIQTPTSLAHRLAVPMPMWALNEMPNPTFPSHPTMYATTAITLVAVTPLVRTP